MKLISMKQALAVAAFAVHLGIVQAHATLSDASLLSTLPIPMSVAAPVMLLSAGATLAVVAVEAISSGTMWVLERASDGARASPGTAGRGQPGSTPACSGCSAVVCGRLPVASPRPGAPAKTRSRAPLRSNVR